MRHSLEEITRFLEVEIERYRICHGPLPCHVQDNIRRSKPLISDILEVVETKLSPDECALEIILSIIKNFLRALIEDRFNYQTNVRTFKLVIGAAFDVIKICFDDCSSSSSSSSCTSSSSCSSSSEDCCETISILSPPSDSSFYEPKYTRNFTSSGLLLKPLLSSADSSSTSSELEEPSSSSSSSELEESSSTELDELSSEHSSSELDELPLNRAINPKDQDKFVKPYIRTTTTTKSLVDRSNYGNIHDFLEALRQT